MAYYYVAMVGRVLSLASVIFSSEKFIAIAIFIELEAVAKFWFYCENMMWLFEYKDVLNCVFYFIGWLLWFFVFTL